MSGQEEISDEFLNALSDELEKISSGRFVSGAKSLGHKLLHNLSGKSVETVAAKHHQNVMNNPMIRRAVRDTPTSQAMFHDFVMGMIRGKHKVPVEILEKSEKHRALVRAIERGRKATRSARIKSHLVRGGTVGAVATPTYLMTKKAKVEDKSLGQRAKELAPSVAGATMATSPIVQGIRSGALGTYQKDIPKSFKSVKDLRAALKPGDVVLVGDPSKGSVWKNIISVMGGDPRAYHVETHAGLEGGKRGKGIWHIHSSPGEGGAASVLSEFSPKEDYIVRRFKDPKMQKKYLENVKRMADAQLEYESVFGSRAAGRTYDTGQAVRGGIKSFLPRPLKKLFTRGSSRAGSAVCSSLTGKCSPVPIAPGVAGKDVMPHDVRRSSVLKTVGEFKAPLEKRRWAAHNKLLQAAPWLFRGAIGAGLGYGAYKGVKALTDR